MENNIYIIGVGGQGAIRLGQIIANYTLRKGEKIKFFKEVGMAQRGGPVHCELRIGDVFGSRIPPYSSDAVVVMELVDPEKYPQNEEITRLFKEAKTKIIWIDAGKIASEAGLSIAENMVLLGALSFVSSFDKESVINMLKKHIPREIDKNIAAFRAGYKTAAGMDK